MEITPAASTSITLQGISLDSRPEDNLCMRAWQLMHQRFDVPPVAIRLRKKIPFGAGLGGGSSDAAYTLRMLNGMFALGLDDEALEALAVQLGADCPFFVRSQAAYATGIGDKLEPLTLDLSPYRIEIALPEGEHVSTREAYAGITPRAALVDLRKAVRLPIEQWRDVIHNDFEYSVFPQHQAIANIKEEMYRRGALFASMSGSGAAVFGLFPTMQ